MPSRNLADITLDFPLQKPNLDPIDPPFLVKVRDTGDQNSEIYNLKGEPLEVFKPEYAECYVLGSGMPDRSESVQIRPLQFYRWRPGKRPPKYGV